MIETEIIALEEEKKKIEKKLRGLYADKNRRDKIVGDVDYMIFLFKNKCDVKYFFDEYDVQGKEARDIFIERFQKEFGDKVFFVESSGNGLGNDIYHIGVGCKE